MFSSVKFIPAINSLLVFDFKTATEIYSIVWWVFLLAVPNFKCFTSMHSKSYASVEDEEVKIYDSSNLSDKYLMTQKCWIVVRRQKKENRRGWETDMKFWYTLWLVSIGGFAYWCGLGQRWIVDICALIKQVV